MTCCDNPSITFGNHKAPDTPEGTRCTVFCLRCRTVFDRELTPVDALFRVRELGETNQQPRSNTCSF